MSLDSKEIFQLRLIRRHILPQRPPRPYRPLSIREALLLTGISTLRLYAQIKPMEIALGSLKLGYNTLQVISFLISYSFQVALSLRNSHRFYPINGVMLM